MPKKGYKWSEKEKKKRSVTMIKVYIKDSTLKERTKRIGNKNGRYIDGRCSNYFIKTSC